MALPAGRCGTGSAAMKRLGRNNTFALALMYSAWKAEGQSARGCHNYAASDLDRAADIRSGTRQMPDGSRVLLPLTKRGSGRGFCQRCKQQTDVYAMGCRGCLSSCFTGNEIGRKHCCSCPTRYASSGSETGRASDWKSVGPELSARPDLETVQSTASMTTA